MCPVHPVIHACMNWSAITVAAIATFDSLPTPIGMPYDLTLLMSQIETVCLNNIHHSGGLHSQAQTPKNQIIQTGHLLDYKSEQQSLTTGVVVFIFAL